MLTWTLLYTNVGTHWWLMLRSHSRLILNWTWKRWLAWRRNQAKKCTFGSVIVRFGKHEKTQHKLCITTDIYCNNLFEVYFDSKYFLGLHCLAGFYLCDSIEHTEPFEHISYILFAIAASANIFNTSCWKFLHTLNLDLTIPQIESKYERRIEK